MTEEADTLQPPRALVDTGACIPSAHAKTLKKREE